MKEPMPQTTNPDGPAALPQATCSAFGKHSARLMAELQLKADMFDYLCWLQTASSPAELRGEPHLCMASDGTTCWGKTYADAVRVAMEHDKGIQDATQPNEDSATPVA